jgi:hypothetical protein
VDPESLLFRLLGLLLRQPLQLQVILIADAIVLVLRRGHLPDTMPVADVIVLHRDHLLDSIDPEGLVAQAGVSVIAPIQVTMVGKVSGKDVIDIALLGLGHPLPKSPGQVIPQGF